MSELDEQPHDAVVGFSNLTPIGLTFASDSSDSTIEEEFR